MWATASRRARIEGQARPQAAQASQACPPELTKLRESGIAAIGRGELVQAAEIFQQGYNEALRSSNTVCAIRYLINLANARFKMFRYRDAMAAYLQARRLARQIGDDEMAAVTSVNTAWLYLHIGALPEAVAAAEQILGSQPEENSPYLAHTLALEGTLCAKQGDWERASRLLSEALKEADRRSDLDTVIGTLDEWGLLLLGAARAAEAEAVLTEALRLARLNHRPVPDHRYRNLAMARLARGDLDSARRLIEAAFRSARLFSVSAPAWSLYYRRAQIRLAAGELEEALADLRSAVESIRDLREDLLPADAIRWKTGVRVDEVYQSYVEGAGRLYRQTRRSDLLASSFEVAEFQRAAALREALGESRDIVDRLPPEYGEVLDRIRSAESSLWKADRPELRQELKRWRQRLTEIELEAALKAPSALPVLRPVSLAAVQQALRPSEALLSFRVGQSRSYLWSVTRDSVALHEIPGRHRLETLIAAFRDAVRRSSPQAAQLGENLYAALFGRLDRHVAAKPDWILLLDGPLFELPLSALNVARSQSDLGFLIERHSLRILPAAALLELPRQPEWQGPFLALGDPVYNTADPRWRPAEADAPQWRRLLNPILSDARESGLEPAGHMARLAGSWREMAACARVFGAGEPAPILLSGDSATFQRLRDQLSRQPAVIHFATHVVPSPETPRTGCIALSLDPGGKVELVGPESVSALRVNSSLVVMSGCASSTGDVLPGEGLLGLSRAWLRAGAGSVAGTLWPVPDDSGELLAAFYGHLVGNSSGGRRPPHEALRLAQLEMLRSPSWRSQPSYWAAYLLFSRR